VGFDLSSIASSKKDRPRRIIVLGKPKCGKSTFATQSDKPVFLPIRGEEGIDDLDVPTFPVINTYADLIEALGTLYVDDHGYSTAVIDSVSTLEPIFWKECCRINQGVDSIEKVGGGFHKGYTEVLKQWREFTDGMDALRNDRNMTIILVGHTSIGKMNDPGCEPYTRWDFDIHKYASALLTRWADGIAFVQHKVIVKKDDQGFGKKTNRALDAGGGQPFLYTQERPSHPGGGRGPWGKLPYEMPLSWAALTDALAKAKK